MASRRPRRRYSNSSSSNRHIRHGMPTAPAACMPGCSRPVARRPTRGAPARQGSSSRGLRRSWLPAHPRSPFKGSWRALGGSISLLVLLLLDLQNCSATGARRSSCLPAAAPRLAPARQAPAHSDWPAHPVLLFSCQLPTLSQCKADPNPLCLPLLLQGAVLLDPSVQPQACTQFEAVLVLLGGHWPARGLLSGRRPAATQTIHHNFCAAGCHSIAQLPGAAPIRMPPYQCPSLTLACRLLSTGGGI